ncbi:MULTISPECIES: hypothetical protein [Enterobacteriaceae]|uniref:hypothetical protein n=1 Tax=Enterobacteriaceae TaxID=543 RepID=UPI000A2E9763|nr:hypothetical protein [Escherichia coli]HBV3315372.1 dipeptidase [Klebsiella pneumoniae]ELC0780105.1 hypothetical protein [Escherichia coli]MBG0899752.1 dipeptidase [Escherichia coli]MBG0924534.1 dipeptidase [Escherichia coli]MCV2428872.1 hypothetical protein [Escherichia coli]
MTDSIIIEDSPKIEFSLFEMEGGFLKYTAPKEIVNAAFSGNYIPDAGTELVMILDSVTEDDSGIATIKIMLKPR